MSDTNIAETMREIADAALEPQRKTAYDWILQRIQQEAKRGKCSMNIAIRTVELQAALTADLRAVGFKVDEIVTNSLLDELSMRISW